MDPSRQYYHHPRASPRRGAGFDPTGLTTGGTVVVAAPLPPPGSASDLAPSPSTDDRTHGRDHDDSQEEANGSGDMPRKKKQKRNKPTLSCHECVERKTKVRLFSCLQPPGAKEKHHALLSTLTCRSLTPRLMIPVYLRLQKPNFPGCVSDAAQQTVSF